MANNNVESVDVVITDELNNAILILARDYKKGDASEMAANLLTQVVKGRLKAKRESAKKDAEEMYDRMMKSLTPELAEMLPSRVDWVNSEITKLDDAIRYL